MLGSLSRFIICENSESSGHIIELGLASTNRFVTAILQQRGTGATWMQSDYSFDFSFMKAFEYDHPDNVEPIVNEALEWAEEKVRERAAYFNKLYPWRA